MHDDVVTGSFHGPPPASATPVLPGRPRTAPAEPRLQPDLEPPYHVILHDDDEHTHRYVVNMMMQIFGYDASKGFQIACEVNESGRAIVVTCHKELAEFRVDQIHKYVDELPAANEPGPMKASMEPAE
ncbi:MAG TPA: Clp protease ClpS [Verrucomicrobiales bacterium]|nr:Clp protease ClpS [Verrucomicrobiales bacterium]